MLRWACPSGVIAPVAGARSARGPGRTDGVRDLSDEALFAGYAAGDPQAAAALVRRTERKVYGLALAIVREPADAQDVAQEAFVRAWRFAASFDERRGVRAGLAAGHHPQRGARQRPGPGPAGRARCTSCRRTGPRSRRRRRAGGHARRRRAVIKLMRELPEAQRQALVAVTLLGLSTREVSERGAIPHGTVTPVRLALRKLRGRARGWWSRWG